MPETDATAWHLHEYGLIRGEIAARASVHHSFMAWSTGGAVAIAALGTTKWHEDAGDAAWMILMPAWVAIVAFVVITEWKHTERLGDYAKSLEAAIRQRLQATIAPVHEGHPSGWEHYLAGTRHRERRLMWIFVVVPLLAGLPGTLYADYHDWKVFVAIPLHAAAGLVCAMYGTEAWKKAKEDESARPNKAPNDANPGASKGL